jgi:hypothetical protein
VILLPLFLPFSLASSLLLSSLSQPSHPLSSPPLSPLPPQSMVVAETPTAPLALIRS